MRRLFLVILGAAACSGGHEEEAVPAVVSARTAKAEVRSFSSTVRAIGVVEARPGTNAALGAPGATRVARVFVTAGQAVHKGDPLIEFERAPFEAAAREAESALTAAQNARDRAARLAEAGVAPRKDVDQANTELARAEAGVITARRFLELATLTSPLEGVVTRMAAAVGTPVDGNVALVEVADPSALDVVFNLSPADAAQVRTSQGVSLSAGDRSEGESLGSARVTSVALAVDSASRGVGVRASLTQPSRALRIGETVYGRIAVATHPRAVVVPADALVPEGEGYKVFVVDSLGIALGHEVTVGGRGEGVVEITEGLEGGETVVTYGAYGMADSARVAPVKP